MLIARNFINKQLGVFFRKHFDNSTNVFLYILGELVMEPVNLHMDS